MLRIRENPEAGKSVVLKVGRCDDLPAPPFNKERLVVAKVLTEKRRHAISTVLEIANHACECADSEFWDTHREDFETVEDFIAYTQPKDEKK